MKKLFKKIVVIAVTVCISITTLNVGRIQAKEIKQQVDSITPEETDYFKGKLRQTPIIGDEKELTIKIGNNLYDVYNIDNLEKIYFVKVTDFTLFSAFRSTCFPGDYGYPYCKGNFPPTVSNPEANEQFIKCVLKRLFGFTPEQIGIPIIIALIKKKGIEEAIKYIASSVVGGPTYIAVKLAWDSASCIIFKN